MSVILRNVVIDWLGHSSFKIAIMGGKTIYIDPYILPEHVQPADIILVTHDHYDHFSAGNILRLLKPETVVVMPDSCSGSSDFAHLKSKAKLQLVGQEGKISVAGIEIESVPAYNIAKPYHPKGKGVGYVVLAGRIRVYHAGDTDLIPEMSQLQKQNIDVALLPIGGTYTMDEKEAAEAVKIIMPKIAVPMHYGKITGGDPYKFGNLVRGACEVKIL